MRTACIRFAIVISSILLFGHARAADPLPSAPLVNSASMERAVEHQINRFVSFPLTDDQAAMYGVVDVAFVVDTEGRIVVVGTDSANPVLCDYVVRKLGKVHVGPNPSGLWNTSHVRFIFRPEE